MKAQKTNTNKVVSHCSMTDEAAKQAIDNIKVSFGKPRKDGSVTVKLNGLPKPLMECFKQIAKSDDMAEGEFFRQAIVKEVI